MKQIDIQKCYIWIFILFHLNDGRKIGLFDNVINSKRLSRMLPFKPMIGFDKEVLNGITNPGKRERMIILCDENKFYYYCNRKNKEEEREREEKEREEKERNNRERDLSSISC